MELKLDTEKFDELQLILIEEIVQKIKIKLMEGGVTGEQLQDLTGEIAFSIASAIDDTAAIESEGVEVRPYLTFRGNNNEIIHCGENSFTQGDVYSMVKKLFAK